MTGSWVRSGLQPRDHASASGLMDCMWGQDEAPVHIRPHGAGQLGFAPFHCSAQPERPLPQSHLSWNPSGVHGVQQTLVS